MRPTEQGPRAEGPTPEGLPEPSFAGSVVLELGGSVGAVIVHTPSTMVDTEIEVRRAGAEWTGAHATVRERTVEGGPLFAVVLGGLEEGDYELREHRTRGDGPTIEVVVVGGRVSRVNWPS
ncbi:MAG: phospholipase [Acidimicrobiales bacterium]